MSKHVYQGDHDGEKIWIDPGILDLHGRPLVNPSIVSEPTKNAFMVETGKAFVIDHSDPKMMHIDQWMRSHQQFKCLDRELLPKGTKSGAGNSY